MGLQAALQVCVVVTAPVPIVTLQPKPVNRCRREAHSDTGQARSPVLGLICAGGRGCRKAREGLGAEVRAEGGQQGPVTSQQEHAPWLL